MNSVNGHQWGEQPLCLAFVMKDLVMGEKNPEGRDDRAQQENEEVAPVIDKRINRAWISVKSAEDVNDQQQNHKKQDQLIEPAAHRLFFKMPSIVDIDDYQQQNGKGVDNDIAGQVQTEPLLLLELMKTEAVFCKLMAGFLIIYSTTNATNGSKSWLENDDET